MIGPMYLALKLIAIPFPWLVMLILGRPLISLICLIGQITLIGWIPAIIGAIYLTKKHQIEKSINNPKVKQNGN